MTSAQPPRPVLTPAPEFTADLTTSLRTLPPAPGASASSSTGTSTSSTASAPSTRWRLVDSLRGFALAGILVVNIPDIARLGYELLYVERIASVSATVLQFTVQTRFVPIFVFLFGLSLFLVMQGALRRSAGRRGPAAVALVLRLAALLVIGMLHSLLYPGEVLREYAVVGLVLIPVVLFAPRWLTLGLGLALTLVAYGLYGGGLPALPGLMLLGSAAAAYELPRILERGGRAVMITFLVAALATAPALLWQTTQPGDPRFTTAGGVAGLVMAVLYVTALSMLWKTGARRIIAGVFEPLGRMALTNYVAASIVVVIVALFVDFTHMVTPLPAIALGGAIIAVQSVLSRVWLSHFAYGPVEWVWRMVTWRQSIPIRGGVL